MRVGPILLGRDGHPGTASHVGPAESLTGTYRIMQFPTTVAQVFNAEVGDDYRQIFLDGRELPQDPNPTWRGYSVGHWEGDNAGARNSGLQRPELARYGGASALRTLVPRPCVLIP
jgi:hypothetical protein